MRRDRLMKWSTFSFGVGWLYFLAVFFVGETFIGVAIPFSVFMLVLLTGVVLFYFSARALLDRRILTVDFLSNFALACGATLFCLILLDIAAKIYIPTAVPDSAGEEDQRLTDNNAWIGEWYPRLYYPTAKNFRLHKPNFSFAGEHYGFFYRPELMRSPTLRNFVFQKQRISMHINALGFRETEQLERCELFALGDSFAFGWGVSDGQVWTDLLGRDTGNCVYNLGIHDASPKQEFLLLDDLLRKNRGSVPIKHLLWLIYDGNDLEDSYEDGRPVTFTRRSTRFLEGTVIESVRTAIYNVVYAIKKESVIYRLRKGELRFAYSGDSEPTAGNGNNPYVIDDVALAQPLYYSSTHGYSFFYRPYVERAAKPKSYLDQHPHRPLLDQTFKDMAALAREFHFKVTVIIIPTSNRLYASYYQLDRVTQQPFLIHYVENLSRMVGFDSINLLAALESYTGEELLYFRDDDHWNPRGHQVVAQIVKNYLSNSVRPPS